MAIGLGIPLFFSLVLIALLCMVWSLYKGAIPSLTSSLIEVGPDVKGQLREISQKSWRPALLVATCYFLLMVLTLFVILASHHFRR